MKLSSFIFIALIFVILLFLKKTKLRTRRKKQQNNTAWPPPRIQRKPELSVTKTRAQRLKQKKTALSAKEKGELAEKKLELALKRRLKKNDWYIFSNVTLKRNDDGGTTQIDLIAVSVFGVFVIEVKNMKGFVYANEGPTWYLHHYPGSKRIYFQNPHRQNHTHVMAIAQALVPIKAIDPKQIKSLVVFMGEAQCKGLPDNSYTDIDSIVEALEANNEKVIPRVSMAVAIGLIEHQRLYDLPETDQAHIEYLQKRHGKELVAE